MGIERSAEIEAFVRERNKAFEARDAAKLEQGLSNDPAVLMIGSDDSEIFRGREAILASLPDDLRSADEIGFVFRTTELEAYCEGDLGWFIAFGTVRIGDAEIPTRTVGIVHREDGAWKTLQNIFSFAVPNAAVEPGSPLAGVLAKKQT